MGKKTYRPRRDRRVMSADTVGSPVLGALIVTQKLARTHPNLWRFRLGFTVDTGWDPDNPVQIGEIGLIQALEMDPQSVSIEELEGDWYYASTVLVHENGDVYITGPASIAGASRIGIIGMLPDWNLGLQFAFAGVLEDFDPV